MDVGIQQLQWELSSVYSCRGNAYIVIPLRLRFERPSPRSSGPRRWPASLTVPQKPAFQARSAELQRLRISERMILILGSS